MKTLQKMIGPFAMPPELYADIRALYRFYVAATVVTQGRNVTTPQWQEFDIAGADAAKRFEVADWQDIADAMAPLADQGEPSGFAHLEQPGEAAAARRAERGASLDHDIPGRGPI